MVWERLGNVWEVVKEMLVSGLGEAKERLMRG